MDTLAIKQFRIDDDIWLRLVREDDVARVTDLVRKNYDHLRTFMEWAKPEYDEHDARDWIERAVKAADDLTTLNYLIMRGTRMIGTIGFASFDHDARVTEIGYWIDRDEQGNGITGRACRKLVEIAFDNLGMDRVQIRCADANVRSGAIPKRLGFKLEGTQRRHVKRDGVIYDFLIYGLLREGWEGKNK